MGVRGLLSVAALVALAMPGAADAARARSKLPKVAVLDFPPERSFDENTNRVLNDFFATDLRQQGFQVISSADMAAVLGLERQRQLLGCTENSCMTELGGALGADYIARGTVAVLGEMTALSLSLQDSRGLEVNRVSVRFRGHDAATLLEKLDETVPKLIQPLHDAGTLPAASGEPSPAPPHQKAEAAPPAREGAPTTSASVAAAPAPSPSTTAQQPEAKSRVVPYALVGGGAAAAIAGGALLFVGNNDLNAWKASANHVAGSNPLSPSRLDAAHKSANHELTAGAIAAGVGLASVGVGVALLVTEGDHPAHAEREARHNPDFVALLLDF